MHAPFRRSRSHLLALIAACVIALVTSGWTMSVGTRPTIAHAAPLNACSFYETVNSKPGFWDALYESQGSSSCVGAPPQGEGWINACSGVPVSANMDTWLTQYPYSGGTRLAESGRTGLKTWASDCQAHEQVSVWGWGQVGTTPLWACLWVYDQTVNLSFDYLCAQDY